MVKVIDKNGVEQSFQGADHFLVTKEGALLLVKSAQDTSITNNVVAFAPGMWQWASK